MTPNRTTGLLLAAMLVLGVAGSVSAQTQVIPGLNTEGSIEAGGRWWLTDDPKNKERAKFEEYRDMGAGPFLERLQLRLFTPDERYSFEILGSKWGRTDQEFSLDGGRTGLWRLQFDWDQLNHVYSTSGRTLEHEISRGVWRAPRINSLTDFNGQATSQELRDVSVQWYTGRLNFTLTPTPDMDLSGKYTMIRKQGDRPFSMVQGTGSGSNFLELLEPIEQTIHDFRLGMTLARENWQLQFGYTLSVFQNDLDSVTFENPCFQVPAGPCAANDINANRRQIGRTALPPSNMANTFSLAGGVKLPLRTRITGNITYSFALQNVDFVPLATTPCPTCGQMPQSSLNGKVETWNVNVSATSHPLPLPLTLSAKYRLYDLKDRSDQILLPARDLNDRTGDTLQPARTAERFSWARHNADVDARYQIIQPVAATVGAGWERWNRGPEREVQESDEYFAKAAVDATPFDWLLARLTYKPSFRRGDYGGHAGADLQGYARRYDEADRDRQRVDLLLQLTPLDTLSISPSASWRHDDYINSPFGVQWETSWSAGVEVDWSPLERLSFTAGYVHEVIDRDLSTRVTFTNLNTDAVSNMRDTFDTFHVSGKMGLIPNVLDWIVGADYSTSYGSFSNRATSATVPGPTVGTLVRRMPDVDDQLLRLETKLSYHFSKAWTASLFYAYEQWRHHDWRTDNWLPYNPQLAGVPSGNIYLGSDPKDYDNHTMGVTLTYRFQ